MHDCRSRDATNGARIVCRRGGSPSPDWGGMHDRTQNEALPETVALEKGLGGWPYCVVLQYCHANITIYEKLHGYLQLN
jgi:hypothetical protein